MIFQLRFKPVLKLNEAPGQFQDRVRERFADFAEADLEGSMPHIDVPTRFEPSAYVRVVDASNGLGTPAPYRFSGIWSRGATATVAGTRWSASLVPSTAKLTRSLAFLPVNTEHERIVDQMVEERLRGAVARKQSRRSQAPNPE